MYERTISDLGGTTTPTQVAIKIFTQETCTAERCWTRDVGAPGGIWTDSLNPESHKDVSGGWQTDYYTSSRRAAAGRAQLLAKRHYYWASTVFFFRLTVVFSL